MYLKLWKHKERSRRIAS